jgi:hypothetical protein
VGRPVGEGRALYPWGVAKQKDDTPDPVPTLDRSITAAVVEGEGEDVMVTSFVVVVEYLNADGAICVTTLTDGQTPVHRLHGLLFAADLDEDFYEYADDEDDAEPE